MHDLAPAAERPASEAGTVVLLRPGSSGMAVEVLLLRRATTGAFAGLWVFPGGRVEAVDREDDGEGAEDLRAAARAAARETAEEAGIVLDPTGLVPLAHWTPPDTAPRRFLTWFFLAAAPAGDIVVDGAEIEEHRWATPHAALAAHRAGQLGLAPPTWLTLWQLDRPATVDELLDDAATATPPRFATRLRRGAEGAQLALWEGDAAYDDDVPLDAPGPRHRLVMTRLPWRYERWP